MQEPSGYSWDTGLRLTKTSEDRYVRSNSSSSQSSVDEPIRSPRSNVFISSNPHHPTNKADFKKVLIMLLSLSPNFLIIIYRFFILLQKLNR